VVKAFNMTGAKNIAKPVRVYPVVEAAASQKAKVKEQKPVLRGCA